MGGSSGGKGAPSVSPTPVVTQEEVEQPELQQNELNRQAEEEEAQAIEESNEEARLAALQEQGREGTILTGSLGATGNAKVRTKTLLGQ